MSEYIHKSHNVSVLIYYFVCPAKYMPTHKNEQVKEFYDKCSFSLIKFNNGNKEYELFVDKYKPKKIKYIKVNNGK